MGHINFDKKKLLISQTDIVFPPMQMVNPQIGFVLGNDTLPHVPIVFKC